MLESPYLFRLMRKRIFTRTNLGIPILIVSRKSKENVLILRSSSLFLEEHFLDILATYTMHPRLTFKKNNQVPDLGKQTPDIVGIMIPYAIRPQRYKHFLYLQLYP